MAMHREIYGQGRPLVMLHGWAMHSGIWRAFAKQLASRFQVICLDLPSHGRSHAVDEFSLPKISEALLDSIPIQKFSLLGWSLGATVAIDMASRRPDRVESLILLAGNPKFVESEDWPGIKPRVLDAFAEQLTGDVGKTLMRFLALQVNGLPNGKRLLQSLKAAIQECDSPPVNALQLGLDILRYCDLRDELAGLVCPVNVIQGDRDGLVPSDCGPALERRVPGISVHVLENAGHVPFLSHDRELIRIIEGILAPGRRLDKPKIRRSFAAAADGYDEQAELQRRVGVELLEKYPMNSEEGVIIDLGCGTGFLSRQLSVDFSLQTLVALDIAMPMLQISKSRNGGMPVAYLCADAEKMPFAANSVRQIYSNLALQWCQDLPVVFADCKRILESGGRLVFATFGPDTLRELKAAWKAVDDYAHVNEFYGEEQIRIFLQDAGFREIESRVEVYRSRYPSVMALMRELKGMGAHNVNLSRNRKTTTRQQLQRMIACYEAAMEGGGVLASYEIISVRASR